MAASMVSGDELSKSSSFMADRSDNPFHIRAIAPPHHFDLVVNEGSGLSFDEIVKPVKLRGSEYARSNATVIQCQASAELSDFPLSPLQTFPPTVSH